MLNDKINIDLHIHSKASAYKDGVIVENSDKEHIETLISKLKDNDITLFSITDHNRFDYELYNNIKQKLAESEEDKKNITYQVLNLM